MQAYDIALILAAACALAAFSAHDSSLPIPDQLGSPVRTAMAAGPMR